MNKEEQYKSIVNFIDSYINNPPYYVNRDTVLAHVLNMLKTNFKYMDWVGVYLKKDAEDLLYLGMYLGSIGCDLIPFSKGVCGKCISTKETQLVPNVHLLPYHIACSSSTNSEIVTFFKFKDGKQGVLDIDSDELDSFDEIDKKYLEEISSKFINF